jgi:membrane-associated protease RseP (regulator of RpoE activity)
MDGLNDVSDVSERAELDSAVDESPVNLWPKRIRLPVLLLLATCLSTFFVGTLSWSWLDAMESANGGWINDIHIRQALLRNWDSGVIYAICLIGILFAHEMGHYVATLIYRVPASLPYFLPFPISIIGTFGAVIAMEGGRPNRRQIFDIGLAGPLAGLVIAVPVLWIGVCQLEPGHNQFGPYRLGLPWVAIWMEQLAHPEADRSEDSPSTDEADERPEVAKKPPKAAEKPQEGAGESGRSHFVWHAQLNPWLMAGWVGMLITGLNMMPMSQLDGGHVLYALFGRRAHWIARGFAAFAAAYIAYSGQYGWILMLSIVFFALGPDHPPTSDDSVELGWFRTVLGLICLVIPFLCFAVTAIV